MVEIATAEIVNLEDHRHKDKNENPPETIKRMVDGELVEYILETEDTFASRHS